MILVIMDGVIVWHLHFRDRCGKCVHEIHPSITLYLLFTQSQFMNSIRFHFAHAKLVNQFAFAELMHETFSHE